MIREIDSGVYGVDKDVSLLTSSFLVIMNKVLIAANEGDNEIMEVFAAQLSDFIQRYNEDEEASMKLEELNRLNSLLDGIDLDSNCP
jgi:hypothetical protein